MVQILYKRHLFVSAQQSITLDLAKLRREMRHWAYFKLRIHDATGCTAGCTTGCIVYTGFRLG